MQPEVIKFLTLGAHSLVNPPYQLPKRGVVGRNNDRYINTQLLCYRCTKDDFVKRMALILISSSACERKSLDMRRSRPQTSSGVYIASSITPHDTESNPCWGWF